MSAQRTSIAVRHMTTADLDRVVEISQRLPEAPHWPRSAYHAALIPHAAVLRIALVAEQTGAGLLAGFAVASLVAPQAELETIAVAPEFRRQGLATRLFSALVAEMRPSGIDETNLEVRASNHPALAFYRRLGFVETGLRPRYYIDPVEDAILMKLPL